MVWQRPNRIKWTATNHLQVVQHCGIWRVFFPIHSLRTGTATTLYAAGVDEQLITEKRDHWSFSVRNFMTSLDKERLVSDIVQERKLSSPPTNKTWDPYHPSVSLQCPSVSVCFHKDASTVTINVKFNSGGSGVLECLRSFPSQNIPRFNYTSSRNRCVIISLFLTFTRHCPICWNIGDLLDGVEVNKNFLNWVEQKMKYQKCFECLDKIVWFKIR